MTIECTVENCKECEAESELCQTCNDDYTLSLDQTTCTQVEVEEVLVATMTTVSVSTTTATVFTAAAGAGTSSASAWVMINQYQLLLTTPVLETEMPEDLLFFLEGFEFSSFQFNFLDGFTLGSIDITVDSFDFEQQAPGLEVIGYDSGSSIVNDYNFAKAILIILCVNFIIMSIYYMLPRMHKYGWFTKLYTKLSSFFAFTLYVRITIEAFYFVFLTALSEIAENTDNVKDATSYTFAIILIGISVVFMVFLMWHYCKYSKTDDFGEEGRLTEAYDGFKAKPLCQLYYFIFCSRRVLNAIIVVSLRTANIYARLVLFNFIQVLALLYAVVIRPFDTVTDNIMEVLNETLFTTFCITISILKDESDWTTSRSNLALSIIMINGLLIALIMAIAFIIEVTGAVRTWLKNRKKSKIEGKLNQLLNMVEYRSR